MSAYSLTKLPSLLGSTSQQRAIHRLDRLSGRGWRSAPKMGAIQAFECDEEGRLEARAIREPTMTGSHRELSLALLGVHDTDSPRLVPRGCFVPTPVRGGCEERPRRFRLGVSLSADPALAGPQSAIVLHGGYRLCDELVNRRGRIRLLRPSRVDFRYATSPKADRQATIAF